MVEGAFLGIEDVKRLLADPSPAARAATAAKVARAYDGRRLNQAERDLARAIIDVLARDAEAGVRQALAEHLKDNPDLPHDVALRLARDVATVAVPLLQFSPVFSDGDLIALLDALPVRQQSAIAGRPRVSAELATALVEQGDEPAVAVLFGNAGATVSPPMMGRALDRFPDSRAVAEALARHPLLPPAYAARLLGQVADALRQTLVERYRIAPAVAAETMLRLRERTLLGLLGAGAEPPQVAALADALLRDGQLTPSLALRALAGGDVAFFHQAAARLAEVTPGNAAQLLADGGKRGLAALCSRAGLPAAFHPMVDAVLAMHSGFRAGVSAADRAFFVESVIDRVLTDFAALWDGPDRRWLERRRELARQAQRRAD